MSWEYHYRWENSLSHSLISFSFFIHFFVCFLLMNINTFITCTTYLCAEWLPPSKSLWLGGLFTLRNIYLFHRNVKRWLLGCFNRFNWLLSLSVESNKFFLFTRLSCGELLTIEWCNKVLCCALSRFFLIFALFHHICTWLSGSNVYQIV